VLLTTVSAPLFAQGIRPADALRHEVTIGGARHEIATIKSLAVSEDGTVALITSGAAQVALFNAMGNPVGTIGRSGEGPGEFRDPWHVGWTTGGTMWVYDGARRAINHFVNGRFHSLAPWATALSVNSGAGAILVRQPVPVAILADASVVAQGLAPKAGDLWVGTVVRQLPGSDQGAFIAEVPAARDCRTDLPGGASILRPFCPRPLVGVDPTSGATVIITPVDERGEPGTFWLRRIAVTGGEGTRQRIRLPQAELPRATRDSINAQALANLADDAAIRNAASRALARDPAIPRITHIVVGSNAEAVWVGSVFRGRNEWFAIDRDGQVRTTLSLAGTDRVLHSRGAQVWIGVEDADGFTSVRRYRLEP
jgi:hypothetical protein